mgnify:FL=1
MSNQQKSYTYYYLTITGEGDAHRLVKEYHLGNARAWNKGEIEQERYQFEQMCIRIGEYYPISDDLDDNDSIVDFLRQPNVTHLNLLPSHFERVIHAVRHGIDNQGYGFYLSADLIRQLAQYEL